MPLESLLPDMTTEPGHRELKLSRSVESQNRVPNKCVAHAERAGGDDPPPRCDRWPPRGFKNCRRTKSLTSFITERPCWTAPLNNQFSAPASLELILDNHGRPIHDFRSPSRLSRRRSHHDDLSIPFSAIVQRTKLIPHINIALNGYSRHAVRWFSFCDVRRKEGKGARTTNQRPEY